jgi:hypothetical protein
MAGNNRKGFLRQLAALALACVMVLVLASVVVAAGPILHTVQVGGPDACEAWGLAPGCDANLSLRAFQYADGSVSGHYSDQFGHGIGGFQADVTCMEVDGASAWIGAVITHGFFRIREEDIYWDMTGEEIFINVVDNGISANDPPDQITYSLFGTGFADCQEAAAEGPGMEGVELFDMPRGQVTVR